MENSMRSMHKARRGSPSLTAYEFQLSDGRHAQNATNNESMMVTRTRTNVRSGGFILLFGFHLTRMQCNSHETMIHNKRIAKKLVLKWQLTERQAET